MSTRSTTTRVRGMRGLVALGVALLGLAVAGAATPQSSQHVVATLDVVHVPGFEGDTATTVNTDLERGAVLELTAPPGFELAAGKAPGSTVGEVFAAVSSLVTDDTSSFVAPLVVDTPEAFAADPVAQACAPGSHLALWRASVSVLGRTVSLPIAVDRRGDRLVLQICLFAPRSPAFPDGLSFHRPTVDLIGALVDRGVLAEQVVWSARVTPFGTDRVTPDPSKVFEMRSTAVADHTVSVALRRQAEDLALLSGRLVLRGAPRGGVEVTVFAFPAAEEDSDEDLQLITLLTDADGRFAHKVKAEHSTLYFVAVRPQSGPCVEPSDAPDGCISDTLARPPARLVFFRVPRATDARIRLRPPDMRLAQRATLVQADLPVGWSDLGVSFQPCVDVAFGLRSLVITGESGSNYWTAPDFSQIATMTADVYATREQAVLAFKRTAIRSHATCFSGTDDPGISPLDIPRIGDATRGYRLVERDSSGVVVADVVFFRVGRLVGTALVGSAGSPPPRAFERGLIKKLVARARQ